MKFSSTLSKNTKIRKGKWQIISSKCLDFKIIFQNFLSVWNTRKLPVSCSQNRRTYLLILCEWQYCPYYCSNRVVFMRWCLMVWIVIIFSESFSEKCLNDYWWIQIWCLPACQGLVRVSLQTVEVIARKDLCIFLCPLLMLLFPLAAKIAGIFAAVLVKLFWVGPVSGTDKLPSIHCRTFGWHWEILWLYCYMVVPIVEFI